MKKNIIRKIPLRYVDQDLFLVHRFPPNTTYEDGYTDYIKRFKNNDKLIIDAWSVVVSKEINNHIKCEYLVRVLGHNELTATNDLPLDILCNQIENNCGIEYLKKALTKKRKTKQFSKARLGVSGRKAELEDNYSFSYAGITKNPTILLIDDVSTSGTTANSIAKAIKIQLPEAKITFLALGQTTNPAFSGFQDNSHYNVTEFEKIIDGYSEYTFTPDQIKALSDHQIVFSRKAHKVLNSLDTDSRMTVRETILQFLIDPTGGGLNQHQIKRTENKWELYLSRGNRLIYERQGTKLIIWDIGNHSIIDRITNKKVGKALFQDSEFFESDFFKIDKDIEKPIIESFYSEYDDEEGSNPFSNFPNSYLRILGIPANVVGAVKSANSVDSLAKIPALPHEPRAWLEQIYLDEKFEEIIYNPADLIFRTTLDNLDGFASGKISKLMINLDEGQQQFVDKDISNPYLLKGCAGSGKTTIGIHKAIAKAADGYDVAYFTFNNNLADVSQQLIEELSGPLPENLHVSTIDSFAYQVLQSPKIIQNHNRKKLLGQAISDVKKEVSHSLLESGLDFIDEEIEHIIQGYGLSTMDQYLNLLRYGRKKALMKKSRGIIWDVFNRYETLRDKKGLLDWSSLSANARVKVKYENEKVKKFDYIIVDETQDLSPIQVRFVQSLLKNSTDSFLFCMADAGQSIYAKGLPWKGAGLEITGKTTILSRNYRNTRQIALFAKEILSKNETLKRESEYIPPDITNKNGPKPELFNKKVNNEMDIIYNRIMDLCGDKTFRLSDIAIICRTNRMVNQFTNYFEKKKVPVLTAKTKPFNILDEKVKILTIHKAKGLEFPVAFIPSVNHDMFPMKISSILDDEGKIAKEEKDILLLYVAITRAADALYMYQGNGYISPFIDINSKNIRLKND